MPESRKVISRLIRYRNAIMRFAPLGLLRVFSDNLADAVGVSSAQVRKDFSILKIKGNKKGGYMIDELLARMEQILGKTEPVKVVIVGAGNIGSALMKYANFRKQGIMIAAGFDIDPDRVNRSADPPVYQIEELRSFIKNNGISTGIIAVPELAAQPVFDMMLRAGIRGVLNFAPIRLRCQDPQVGIKSVNLALELENLIYYVNSVKNGRKK